MLGNIPTHLQPYLATQASTEAAVVELALRCTCGGEKFNLTAFPVILGEDAHEIGMDPGEVMHRPPHSALCTSCGTNINVFDARIHGYDGVLNEGCSYDSGEGAAAIIAHNAEVKLTPAYSIDDEELSELAEEAGVPKSELFDAITIIASGSDSTVELFYECA